MKSSKGPLISIIVPVYNTEKYLHSCIDSILSQTFTDFELLLIDDGSKDNSGAICDGYAAKDARVRVFHKKNGGASSARNMGLDNAKGEWISFVDSDDYVLPFFLETYMALCKDDTELCVSGIIPDYSISSSFRIDKSSIDYEGNVKDALFLLHNCQMIGSLCNKLFKKSIIESNSLYLNETFKFREDEDFLLCYMCHIEKVVCTSKCSYVYFPDFRKYSNVDSFPVCLSMYDSICKIYGNEVSMVKDSYLLGLFNVYFCSFIENDIKYNYVERTKYIKSVVGKRILSFEKLSLISRLTLYYFPANFVSWAFSMKANILKVCQKFR